MSHLEGQMSQHKLEEVEYFHALSISINLNSMCNYSLFKIQDSDLFSYKTTVQAINSGRW